LTENSRPKGSTPSGNQDGNFLSEPPHKARWPPLCMSKAAKWPMRGNTALGFPIRVECASRDRSERAPKQLLWGDGGVSKSGGVPYRCPASQQTRWCGGVVQAGAGSLDTEKAQDPKPPRGPNRPEHRRRMSLAISWAPNVEESNFRTRRQLGPN